LDMSSKEIKMRTNSAQGHALSLESKELIPTRTA
jgi:hypothetical protein